MVDIIFHVSSAAVNATTCICETPANLRAETNIGAHPQKLFPDGAGTNSTAWGLISAAASCLLVILLILLLKSTLHVVAHWHGRFLRLFLRATLLRPNNVDRTCPGHDRGSSAGTRQGDPKSSPAYVQPALTLPGAAGRRRNIGGKRPGDDGSDAEDNDRPKRPRRVSKKETQPSFVCPFKAKYPDDPKYMTCGAFYEWGRLREHLLDRRHKPRNRCAVCGDIFTDDDQWDLHTSARTCEPSPRALERPFWVERDQAASIRDLSRRGSRTESMEEMYRKVFLILFGSESGPDGTAWAHPTRFPNFQHTDDPDMNQGHQEPWNNLKRTTANLLGMQDVPRDDSMQQIINTILSYLGMAQPHAVPSHEPGAEDAAAHEQLGNDETIVEDWMPPATPTEGQVPRISEPHGYISRGSEGELEHSLSNVSTYLSADAGDPSPLVPLDPTQASVGYRLEEQNYDPGFVNPVLLQRQDAHHIHVPVPNDSSTSAALPSSFSQTSEATALGSSSDQVLDDAGYSKNEQMLDNLDDFDFSVNNFSQEVDSVRLSDGGAPDQQQSGYQDVPSFE